MKAGSIIDLRGGQVRVVYSRPMANRRMLNQLAILDGVNRGHAELRLTDQELELNRMPLGPQACA